MKDDKETSKKTDENGSTREKLIRSALESKLEAIGGYDDILWKIRAGYVAILYGSTLAIFHIIVNFCPFLQIQMPHIVVLSSANYYM